MIRPRLIASGLIFATVVLVLAACAPLARPVQAPAATWEAGQEAYLAWNGARPGWTTTPSGLQAHRLTRAKSKAPRPVPGATVTVNYEGRLITGEVFDSSWARHEPATFPLGRVIKGWQEGVPMMRPGETWEFAIPATLAYGAKGRPSIPVNAVLLFKIELISG